MSKRANGEVWKVVYVDKDGRMWSAWIGGNIAKGHKDLKPLLIEYKIGKKSWGKDGSLVMAFDNLEDAEYWGKITLEGKDIFRTKILRCRCGEIKHINFNIYSNPYHLKIVAKNFKTIFVGFWRDILSGATGHDLSVSGYDWNAMNIYGAVGTRWIEPIEEVTNP